MNEPQDNHKSSAPAEPRPSPLTLSDRVRSLRLPNRPAPTRSPSSWIAWTLCAIFAGLSAFLSYRNLTTETPAPRTTEPAVPAVTPNRTPSGPGGRVALEAGGYVIPVRRVQVSPKVGGEVLELFIEEGQRVEKGQVLAKLDPAKYEFEYRRTRALAEQARAEYEKLKTGNREEEKKHSEAALNEAIELCNQLRDQAARVKRSGSGASAEDLVKIESQRLQAELKVQQLRQTHKMMVDGPRKEDIQKAEAAYHHALAQRDNAKYDLDNTEVRAPISGIILVKKAEVGNTVRPEAFSNGLSASLCEMANLKELEVDVDVSERDLYRVALDQRCEIRTEAFPDKVYTGRVARLMPEAQRSKACVSVRVRIDVPDNDVMLLPEMRARVTFLTNGK
jgi:HlyD family secretion protein